MSMSCNDERQLPATTTTTTKAIIINAESNAPSHQSDNKYQQPAPSLNYHIINSNNNNNNNNNIQNNKQLDFNKNISHCPLSKSTSLSLSSAPSSLSNLEQTAKTASIPVNFSPRQQPLAVELSPSKVTMAMHNFGPNSLQQQEHQQQIKSQQQQQQRQQTNNNSVGDSSVWHNTSNTSAGGDNLSGSDARQSSTNNNNNINNNKINNNETSQNKSLSQATNSETNSSMANTNRSMNNNLNRHHQQQSQLQLPQFQGMFNPNLQIPPSLQTAFESRVDQIIRTTLHDSPAYTPATSKGGGNTSNNNNNSNNNSGLSTTSGNMLSPSSSSSTHIFNPAPNMMNNTTPVSSAPLNLLSHSQPPSSGSGPQATPPNYGAQSLSAMNDMSNNGPNSGIHGGNLLTKTSSHSSASHSALAAAAALQSLNQSHIQRSQQQLAHTQQAPFLNAAPLTTTKPPSNGNGGNGITPMPQAAHANNAAASSQMAKICPTTSMNNPATDIHRGHHLAGPNGHQDNSGDSAPRSQSIDAGNIIDNSNNNNNKMLPQTASASSINLPPTGPAYWPPNDPHTNHPNGMMSRFLPSNLNQQHSGPHNYPPPRSPYELNNSNMSIGLNLNNSTSSAGSDSDNLSRSNLLKNLPGQFNPSQMHHDDKTFSSNFRDAPRQPQTFDTSRGGLPQSNNNMNLSNEAALRLQPGGGLERITEERLAIFAYNLFSATVPGKDRYKTIIPLTPGMINDIRDGKFYSHFPSMAEGILMNVIIIPDFSIIDYLRRDRFSLEEVEKIEQVNRKLSMSDLLCLMELVRQRPPSSGGPMPPSSGLSNISNPSPFNGANFPCQSMMGAPMSNIRKDIPGGNVVGVANPLISSSPNRPEMSGLSGLDKSRRLSQSPSDIYRSHMGGNSNNSKFMNVQISNHHLNNQQQPLQQQPPSHQFAQSPFQQQHHQQQNNNNLQKVNPQHISPQGNRSSPFQAPMMIGQPHVTRPPRSHSTIGGLGFGAMNSPYTSIQFPPAAHQNSSRPNLSALTSDIIPAHAHSSNVPVSAHMSSKTPQTPRLLPPPPGPPLRGTPLSTNPSPNKLLLNKDSPQISSQPTGYTYPPPIPPNQPPQAQIKPNNNDLMAAYKQQQLLLSNRLIDNGPGALHPQNKIPVTPHSLSNPFPHRVPTMSEPMTVDIQAQGQMNSPKTASTANQRSIITGSASTGNAKKGKKAKASPTAVAQQSEATKTQIDLTKPYNGVVDINRGSIINNEAPLAVGVDLQMNNPGISSIASAGINDDRALASHDAVSALQSVESAGSTNLDVARGLDAQKPLALQENVISAENNLITTQPPIESSSTDTITPASNISLENTKQTDSKDEFVPEKSVSNSCPQDQSEAIEPSKYHKLYTKKAWLKNYNAEDQSPMVADKFSADTDKVDQTASVKTESETKTQVIDDNNAQTKSNGSVKSSKNLKRRTKEDKSKKSNSTVPTTKSNRTTVKTDNDSEETAASASDLDDTDETDSVKSMADQKVRRMPRRKVKSSAEREVADQQPVAKSKASRDRELSRKRIKREKPANDSTTTSKRKCTSDDESGKQTQAKKTKSEDPAQSVNVHISSRKRTGEKFLQTQPCYEIVPKNIRCLECRRVRQSSLKSDKGGQTKQSSKTNWDDFCRFFEFRKLRYNKAGKIVVAGFLESIDAKESERKLWRSNDVNKELDKLRSISTKSAQFILSNIGHEFCKLVLQERAVESSWHHNNHNKSTTWKRTVNGLRELCDVCSTTLFNCQFVCDRCGFVVCIDCCQSRSESTQVKDEEELSTKEDSNDPSGNSVHEHDQSTGNVKRSKKDTFGWMLCAKNEEHSHDKLTLATIIPPFCLEDLWTKYHDLLRRLKLDTCTNCKPSTIINEWNAEESSVDDMKIKQEPGSEQEGSHSTLKGLLLATAGAKDEVNDDAPVAPKENGMVANREFDFGNEEDSQDDSRQVSAAIEGCIASLNIEGQDEKHDTDIERGSSDKDTGNTLRSLCGGDLLVLDHQLDKENSPLFQEHWRKGKPVLVRGVHDSMNIDMWLPQFFLSKFGEYRSDLVDCRNGDIHRQSMRKYWDGFEPSSSKKQRVKDEFVPTHIPATNNEEPSAITTSYYSGSALWRLKDWPPGQDFKEILPDHYEDFMNNLPLKSYTTRNGKLNLACRLPDEMVSPDLGPKMYSAYGTTKFPERGTTNLHLDISDAINVMVYVAGAMPFRQGSNEYGEIFDKTVDECQVEPAMKKEIKKRALIPGALWHLFKPSDVQKMRDFLNKVSDERKLSPDKRVDPIHDQIWYLDQTLLDRMEQEYGVKSYPILQCMGDAILIPAGTPHQVKNLQNCIKVANDFVSPENIKYCLKLTSEFRQLPETHINQQDKLQIKNIIYYSMKDSVLVTDMNLDKQTTIQTDEDDDGDQTDDGGRAD